MKLLSHIPQDIVKLTVKSLSLKNNGPFQLVYTLAHLENEIKSGSKGDDGLY